MIPSARAKSARPLGILFGAPGGLARVFFVVCLWILPSAMAVAQGTLIHHVVLQPQVPVNREGVFYLLDFNSDGIADLEFAQRSAQTFEVFPEGTNAVLAIPATPPDVGSDGLRFSGGELIGPMAPTGAEWIRSFTGYGIEVGSTLSACYSFSGQLVCFGEFTASTGYLGAQFYAGSDVHYGWVLVQGGAGIGWIKEYAYNTAPGESILAGQVPEPGTFALLLLGGNTALAWRWRRLLRGHQ